MKFFSIGLLIFIVFDSLQGSTISHKRTIRALNTTFQTNFNGTYQRRNPCTNAEVERSSYRGTHEFHHHVKEADWSDYVHKYKALINNFLHAISNLCNFKNRQNGTFNFNINTTVSHHSNGHCNESSKSVPTIVIQATECQPPSEQNRESPQSAPRTSQISDFSKSCPSEKIVKPPSAEDEKCAKLGLQSSQSCDTTPSADKNCDHLSPNSSTEPVSTVLPVNNEYYPCNQDLTYTSPQPANQKGTTRIFQNPSSEYIEPYQGTSFGSSTQSDCPTTPPCDISSTYTTLPPQSDEEQNPCFEQTPGDQESNIERNTQKGSFQSPVTYPDSRPYITLETTFSPQPFSETTQVLQKDIQPDNQIVQRPSPLEKNADAFTTSPYLVTDSLPSETETPFQTSMNYEPSSEYPTPLSDNLPNYNQPASLGPNALPDTYQTSKLPLDLPTTPVFSPSTTAPPQQEQPFSNVSPSEGTDNNNIAFETTFPPTNDYGNEFRFPQSSTSPDMNNFFTPDTLPQSPVSPSDQISNSEPGSDQQYESSEPFQTPLDYTVPSTLPQFTTPAEPEMPSSNQPESVNFETPYTGSETILPYPTNDDTQPDYTQSPVTADTNIISTPDTPVTFNEREPGLNQMYDSTEPGQESPKPMDFVTSTSFTVPPEQEAPLAYNPEFKNTEIPFVASETTLPPIDESDLNEESNQNNFFTPDIQSESPVYFKEQPEALNQIKETEPYGESQTTFNYKTTPAFEQFTTTPPQQEPRVPYNPQLENFNNLNLAPSTTVKPITNIPSESNGFRASDSQPESPKSFFDIPTEPSFTEPATNSQPEGVTFPYEPSTDYSVQPQFTDTPSSFEPSSENIDGTSTTENTYPTNFGPYSSSPETYSGPVTTDNTYPTAAPTSSSEQLSNFNVREPALNQLDEPVGPYQDSQAPTDFVVTPSYPQYSTMAPQQELPKTFSPEYQNMDYQNPDIQSTLPQSPENPTDYPESTSPLGVGNLPTSGSPVESPEIFPDSESMPNEYTETAPSQETPTTPKYFIPIITGFTTSSPEAETPSSAEPGFETTEGPYTTTGTSDYPIEFSDKLPHFNLREPTSNQLGNAYSEPQNGPQYPSTDYQNVDGYTTLPPSNDYYTGPDEAGNSAPMATDNFPAYDTPTESPAMFPDSESTPNEFTETTPSQETPATPKYFIPIISGFTTSSPEAETPLSVEPGFETTQGPFTTPESSEFPPEGPASMSGQLSNFNERQPASDQLGDSSQEPQTPNDLDANPSYSPYTPSPFQQELPVTDGPQYQNTDYQNVDADTNLPPSNDDYMVPDEVGNSAPLATDNFPAYDTPTESPVTFPDSESTPNEFTETTPSQETPVTPKYFIPMITGFTTSSPEAETPSSAEPGFENTEGPFTTPESSEFPSEGPASMSGQLSNFNEREPASNPLSESAEPYQDSQTPNEFGTTPTNTKYTPSPLQQEFPRTFTPPYQTLDSETTLPPSPDYYSDSGYTENPAPFESNNFPSSETPADYPESYPSSESPLNNLPETANYPDTPVNDFTTLSPEAETPFPEPIPENNEGTFVAPENTEIPSETPTSFSDQLSNFNVREPALNQLGESEELPQEPQSPIEVTTPSFFQSTTGQTFVPDQTPQYNSENENVNPENVNLPFTNYDNEFISTQSPVPLDSNNLYTPTTPTESPALFSDEPSNNNEQNDKLNEPQSPYDFLTKSPFTQFTTPLPIEDKIPLSYNPEFKNTEVPNVGSETTNLPPMDYDGEPIFTENPVPNDQNNFFTPNTQPESVITVPEQSPDFSAPETPAADGEPVFADPSTTPDIFNNTETTPENQIFFSNEQRPDIGPALNQIKESTPSYEGSQTLADSFTTPTPGTEGPLFFEPSSKLNEGPFTTPESSEFPTEGPASMSGQLSNFNERQPALNQLGDTSQVPQNPSDFLTTTPSSPQYNNMDTQQELPVTYPPSIPPSTDYYSDYPENVSPLDSNNFPTSDSLNESPATLPNGESTKTEFFETPTNPETPTTVDDMTPGNEEFTNYPETETPFSEPISENNEGTFGAPENTEIPSETPTSFSDQLSNFNVREPALNQLGEPISEEPQASNDSVTTPSPMAVQEELPVTDGPQYQNTDYQNVDGYTTLPPSSDYYTGPDEIGNSAPLATDNFPAYDTPTESPTMFPDSKSTPNEFTETTPSQETPVTPKYFIPMITGFTTSSPEAQTPSSAEPGFENTEGPFTTPDSSEFPSEGPASMSGQLSNFNEREPASNPLSESAEPYQDSQTPNEFGTTPTNTKYTPSPLQQEFPRTFTPPYQNTDDQNLDTETTFPPSPDYYTDSDQTENSAPLESNYLPSSEVPAETPGTFMPDIQDSFTLSPETETVQPSTVLNDGPFTTPESSDISTEEPISLSDQLSNFNVRKPASNQMDDSYQVPETPNDFVTLPSYSPYDTPSTQQELPVTYGPPSTQQELPVTYGPSSTQQELPVTYGPPSTQQELPVTYGPPSTQQELPVTYGPPSTQEELPVTYGPPSTQQELPVTYGPSSTQQELPVTYGPSSTQQEPPVTYGPPIQNMNYQNVDTETPSPFEPSFQDTLGNFPTTESTDFSTKEPDSFSEQIPNNDELGPALNQLGTSMNPDQDSQTPNDLITPSSYDSMPVQQELPVTPGLPYQDTDNQNFDNESTLSPTVDLGYTEIPTPLGEDNSFTSDTSSESSPSSSDQIPDYSENYNTGSESTFPPNSDYDPSLTYTDNSTPLDGSDLRDTSTSPEDNNNFPTEVPYELSDKLSNFNVREPADNNLGDPTEANQDQRTPFDFLTTPLYPRYDDTNAAQEELPATLSPTYQNVDQQNIYSQTTIPSQTDYYTDSDSAPLATDNFPAYDTPTESPVTFPDSESTPNEFTETTPSQETPVTPKYFIPMITGFTTSSPEAQTPSSAEPGFENTEGPYTTPESSEFPTEGPASMSGQLSNFNEREPASNLLGESAEPYQDSQTPNEFGTTPTNTKYTPSPLQQEFPRTFTPPYQTLDSETTLPPSPDYYSDSGYTENPAPLESNNFPSSETPADYPESYPSSESPLNNLPETANYPDTPVNDFTTLSPEAETPFPEPIPENNEGTFVAPENTEIPSETPTSFSDQLSNFNVREPALNQLSESPESFEEPQTSNDFVTPSYSPYSTMTSQQELPVTDGPQFQNTDYQNVDGYTTLPPSSDYYTGPDEAGNSAPLATDSFPAYDTPTESPVTFPDSESTPNEFTETTPSQETPATPKYFIPMITGFTTSSPEAETPSSAEPGFENTEGPFTTPESSEFPTEGPASMSGQLSNFNERQPASDQLGDTSQEPQNSNDFITTPYPTFMPTQQELPVTYSPQPESMDNQNLDNSLPPTDYTTDSDQTENSLPLGPNNFPSSEAPTDTPVTFQDTESAYQENPTTVKYFIPVIKELVTPSPDIETPSPEPSSVNDEGIYTPTENNDFSTEAPVPFSGQPALNDVSDTTPFQEDLNNSPFSGTISPETETSSSFEPGSDGSYPATENTFTTASVCDTETGSPDCSPVLDNNNTLSTDIPTEAPLSFSGQLPNSNERVPVLEQLSESPEVSQAPFVTYPQFNVGSSNEQLPSSYGPEQEYSDEPYLGSGTTFPPTSDNVSAFPETENSFPSNNFFAPETTSESPVPFSDQTPRFDELPLNELGVPNEVSQQTQTPFVTSPTFTPSTNSEQVPYQPNNFENSNNNLEIKIHSSTNYDIPSTVSGDLPLDQLSESTEFVNPESQTPIDFVTTPLFTQFTTAAPESQMPSSVEGPALTTELPSATDSNCNNESDFNDCPIPLVDALFNPDVPTEEPGSLPEEPSNVNDQDQTSNQEFDPVTSFLTSQFPYSTVTTPSLSPLNSNAPTEPPMFSSGQDSNFTPPPSDSMVSSLAPEIQPAESQPFVNNYDQNAGTPVFRNDSSKYQPSASLGPNGQPLPLSQGEQFVTLETTPTPSSYGSPVTENYSEALPEADLSTSAPESLSENYMTSEDGTKPNEYLTSSTTSQFSLPYSNYLRELSTQSPEVENFDSFSTDSQETQSEPFVSYPYDMNVNDSSTTESSPSDQELETVPANEQPSLAPSASRPDLTFFDQLPNAPDLQPESFPSYTTSQPEGTVTQDYTVFPDLTTDTVREPLPDVNELPEITDQEPQSLEGPAQDSLNDSLPSDEQDITTPNTESEPDSYDPDQTIPSEEQTDLRFDQKSGAPDNVRFLSPNDQALLEPERSELPGATFNF